MPVPGRGPSLGRARSCCPGPRARGMGERTAFSLLITRRPGHARSKPAQCAIAARQCGTDKALHWLELGGHWQASGVRRATAVTEWMPGRDLHFRTSPCRRSPSERPTTRRPGIPPGAITALAPPSPAPAPTCASKRRTKRPRAAYFVPIQPILVRHSDDHSPDIGQHLSPLPDADQQRLALAARLTRCRGNRSDL